jgi:hypothetical protein
MLSKLACGFNGPLRERSMGPGVRRDDGGFLIPHLTQTAQMKKAKANPLWLFA